MPRSATRPASPANHASCTPSSDRLRPTPANRSYARSNRIRRPPRTAERGECRAPPASTDRRTRHRPHGRGQRGERSGEQEAGDAQHPQRPREGLLEFGPLIGEPGESGDGDPPDRDREQVRRPTRQVEREQVEAERRRAELATDDDVVDVHRRQQDEARTGERETDAQQRRRRRRGCQPGQRSGRREHQDQRRGRDVAGQRPVRQAHRTVSLRGEHDAHDGRRDEGDQVGHGSSSLWNARVISAPGIDETPSMSTPTASTRITAVDPGAPMAPAIDGATAYTSDVQQRTRRPTPTWSRCAPPAGRRPAIGSRRRSPRVRSCSAGPPAPGSRPRTSRTPSGTSRRARTDPRRPWRSGRRRC